MPRCPVCDSFRIVIVVSPTRRAFCVSCGARWLQEGSTQRRVRPARPNRVGGATQQPAPA